MTVKAADMDLLREFARNASEEAFAAIVSRHVDLVFSVARRRVLDFHTAEEVTQAVFVLLARKAGQLGSDTILSAWLCRTAHYVSGDALKTRRRRLEREQLLAMEQPAEPSVEDPGIWDAISPLLDEVLSELGEKDHCAIVLRYFEGMDMRQVGLQLGVSETAARTRVCRATERLRRGFQRRGIAATAAALGLAISSHSVVAAPASLGATVTAGALHGTALSPAALSLVQNTLKLMAWMKTKSLLAAGIVAIALMGTATVVVQRNRLSPPLTNFRFAGYATPEDTIQTMLWAAGTGDFNKFLDCFTPEERARFQQRVGNRSALELGRKGQALARAMVDFQIVEREEVSTNEIRLHIVAPPSQDGLHSGRNTTIFHRVNGEWKRAGDID